MRVTVDFSMGTLKTVNLHYYNQQNSLPQLKEKENFLDPNSLKKNSYPITIIKTLSRILEATVLMDKRLNIAKTLERKQMKKLMNYKAQLKTQTCKQQNYCKLHKPSNNKHQSSQFSNQDIG